MTAPHVLANIARGWNRDPVDLPHWRWLAERRIERAKELLADIRLSLTDVAQTLGYSGQTTFGEAIRRATGMTPGRYRREVLR